MLLPSGKFAHLHIGGAERAVGETERVGLVMPLRFGKKLQCSLLLHGDLAGDVVGRPYSVKDRALLQRLGVFISPRLRLQQHFPGFGCGVAAACETARRLDFPFVVTARAENFVRGNTDLDDAIVRLQAYEQTGADVLYAPGLTTTDQIRSVCDAITKPVNVLARPNLSLREIADAGARRISTGGRLTWVAVNAFVDAATAIRDGDFSSLDGSSEFAQWLAP